MEEAVPKYCPDYPAKKQAEGECDACENAEVIQQTFSFGAGVFSASLMEVGRSVEVAGRKRVAANPSVLEHGLRIERRIIVVLQPLCRRVFRPTIS
jgi:hypothetical protein